MRACLGINIELPSLSSCGQGAWPCAGCSLHLHPWNPRWTLLPFCSSSCPSASWFVFAHLSRGPHWELLQAWTGADCSLNVQGRMRSLPWERLGKCPLCTAGCRTLNGASRTGLLPWLLPKDLDAYACLRNNLLSFHHSESRGMLCTLACFSVFWGCLCFYRVLGFSWIYWIRIYRGWACEVDI